MRDPNSAGNKKPEEKKFHQLGLVALWQVRLKRARYEKCATGYCGTTWLICAEILLRIIFTIIFMQSRGKLKGQKFWAAVGASPENISAHRPKIFLDILRKYSSGICWKYFWASPGNILAGLEQFLCNATNQVWQIRLWGLQPAWHIYCPGKFETLVNLSFHSYIFFSQSLQKQSDFEMSRLIFKKLQLLQFVGFVFVNQIKSWISEQLSIPITHPRRCLWHLHAGDHNTYISITVCGPWSIRIS